MPVVHDNPAALRYELTDGSSVIGEIRYRREPGAVALVYTDIDPAYEGRGFASILIEGALRDLRDRGLRVVPVCPLVQDWLGKHPEFNDLVTADDAVPE
jgi:predicted GNAT family acetyltransferase